MVPASAARFNGIGPLQPSPIERRGAARSPDWPLPAYFGMDGFREPKSAHGGQQHLGAGLQEREWLLHWAAGFTRELEPICPSAGREHREGGTLRQRRMLVERSLMQRPYREPSPATVDPTADGDFEAEFHKKLARRRALLMGLLGVGVLVVASPFLYIALGVYRAEDRERAHAKASQLSDAQVAELGDLLDRAGPLLTAREADFRAAIPSDDLERLQPGDGTCSDAPQAPTASAASSYSEYGSIDGNYFGNASYTLVGVTSDRNTLDLRRLYEAPRVATLNELSLTSGARATVERVRGSNAKREATKADLEELRVLSSGSSAKLTFVVVRELTEPLVDSAGKGTYVGATLRGRAYVYRTDLRRIACVGDIDVHNSPSIDIRYQAPANGLPTSNRTDAAQVTLQRDLDIQIRRALATDLRTPAAR